MTDTDVTDTDTRPPILKRQTKLELFTDQFHLTFIEGNCEKHTSVYPRIVPTTVPPIVTRAQENWLVRGTLPPGVEL